jgi:hypothetical protein
MVIAAIAVGLGGGLVAGNIMNPIASRPGPDAAKPTATPGIAKLEQRAEPAQASSAPSGRVEYLTGSQAFGAIFAQPAQTQAQAQPTKSDAEPQADQPALRSAGGAGPVAQRPALPAGQQASSEPNASPDNAYAKAKDTDVKRAASERRRAERHQRRAERRRQAQRGGGTDWDDLAGNVREDSEIRDFTYSRRPVFPQGQWFGPDD